MISRLRERLTALRGKVPSSEKMNEGLGRWLAQKTFSTADRLTLYEDLAFLLDNNLKVEKAINSMIGSYGNKRPPVVYCLEDMLSALRQGRSVDQGLAPWIPRQEAAILSSGVQDGNLAAALYRAITVVQGMSDMKSALVSTLAYPMLLMATTFAMMKMVTVYFLPRLESLSSRENWTGVVVAQRHLRVLCQSCNHSQWADDPVDWVRYLVDAELDWNNTTACFGPFIALERVSRCAWRGLPAEFQCVDACSGEDGRRYRDVESLCTALVV